VTIIKRKFLCTCGMNWAVRIRILLFCCLIISAISYHNMPNHIISCQREPGYLSVIALGYGLHDLWFESRQELGDFSSPPCPDGSGAHLASYPMGTRSSFPGGKAAGV
jgi:hypothetical protein